MGQSDHFVLVVSLNLAKQIITSNIILAHLGYERKSPLTEPKADIATNRGMIHGTLGRVRNANDWNTEMQMHYI